MIHEANRMKKLPPYLFTIIDNIKKRVSDSGVDVIDLSMGSPDIPAPEHVVKELCAAVQDPEIHCYPRKDDKEDTELKQAIADWYKGRFGIKLEIGRAHV